MITLKNKKGGAGIVIFIIILLIIIGIGIFLFIQSGALERAIDLCEKAFDDCNHGCGEGLFNSVCKEKCSYDYRRCKG